MTGAICDTSPHTVHARPAHRFISTETAFVASRRLQQSLNLAVTHPSTHTPSYHQAHGVQNCVDQDGDAQITGGVRSVLLLLLLEKYGKDGRTTWRWCGRTQEVVKNHYSKNQRGSRNVIRGEATNAYLRNNRGEHQGHTDPQSPCRQNAIGRTGKRTSN